METRSKTLLHPFSFETPNLGGVMRENENTFLALEMRKGIFIQQLEVNINFDEASECWKANKKSIGNGCYHYICLQKTKTGNKCNRKPEINSDFCKIHNKNKNKNKNSL